MSILLVFSKCGVELFGRSWRHSRVVLHSFPHFADPVFEVFFGGSTPCGQFTTFARGPSERIIQVVPLAPASFPASPGSVVENCHLLGENTLLKNTHWFQCYEFFLDGMLTFLCESRLFQKTSPEKRAFNPEHDIPPPF